MESQLHFRILFFHLHVLIEFCLSSQLKLHTHAIEIQGKKKSAKFTAERPLWLDSNAMQFYWRRVNFVLLSESEFRLVLKWFAWLTFKTKTKLQLRYILLSRLNQNWSFSRNYIWMVYSNFIGPVITGHARYDPVTFHNL